MEINESFCCPEHLLNARTYAPLNKPHYCPVCGLRMITPSRCNKCGGKLVGYTHGQANNFCPHCRRRPSKAQLAYHALQYYAHMLFWDEHMNERRKNDKRKYKNCTAWCVYPASVLAEPDTKSQKGNVVVCGVTVHAPFWARTHTLWTLLFELKGENTWVLWEAKAYGDTNVAKYVRRALEEPTPSWWRRLLRAD